MTSIELVLVFVLACVTTAAIIPPIRRIAVWRRLLDWPDDGRRTHKHPIPRLGGVAVFAGFVLAVTGGVLYQLTKGTAEAAVLMHTAQLLGACAILFTIGLADDIRGVPPIIKLVGQTAAALIVQYNWVSLPAIVLPPNITISLGWLGVPITVLWLVGVSNALNLVDGLDGLAGGVSVIALSVFVAASFFLHNSLAPIASIALAGAMVGFLRFNYPPAKIFLGDSGSLVVGFLLAFFALRRTARPDGAVLAVVPIFALSYPLLDTGLAMLRRWLRGHPLSRADGRHVHHQLLALGLSPRRAVISIYAYSIVIGTLGLCVTFAPPAFTVAVTMAGLAILLLIFVYGVRWLEYHEFRDAGAVLAAAGSLARGAIRDSIYVRDAEKLIAQAETLDQVDFVLGSHADVFRFEHMQIGGWNASLPAAFAARADQLWKLEYPVCATGQGDGTTPEFLVLTIWCPKLSRVRPASAQRVANGLSRAIAEWQRSASPAVGHDIRLRATSPVASQPAIRPRSPGRNRNSGDRDLAFTGEHEPV